MQRRDFIKSSAAVAAGLVFVKPGSVYGTPANDAISVGIIGCGGRGQAIGRELVTAGARVVALHDLFDDRLAETREQFDKLADEKGLPKVDRGLPRGGRGAVGAGARCGRRVDGCARSA